MPMFFRKTLSFTAAFFVVSMIFIPLLIVRADPPTTGGVTSLPTTGGYSGTGIINPVKATTLHGLINSIVTALLNFGAVVAVVAMIYSGFLFVKARGNPEELETAKKTFLYTVIGIAVLLGARVISQIIENTITQLK